MQRSQFHGRAIFWRVYATVRDSLLGDSSIVKAMMLTVIFRQVFGVRLGYSYISGLTNKSGLAAGGHVLTGLIFPPIWEALVSKF